MLYSVLFLLPVRKGGTILNGVSIQERGLTQRVYDNFTTYFSNGKTVIPPKNCMVASKVNVSIYIDIDMYFYIAVM